MAGSRGSTLRITVFHGAVRATPMGPSFNSNTHYVSNVLNTYARGLEAGEEPAHILVLHAYPSTGYIPAYIRDPERAREKIRTRRIMVNPNALVAGNPLTVVRNAAERLGLGIVYGPVYEVAGPRYYETTVVVTPEGDLLKYRKICLTDLERGLGLSPGREPLVYEHPGVGRVGIFIGEDLACPEVFRAYRHLGVDVLIGHLMPYPAGSIPMVRNGEAGIVGVDNCLLDKILTVRSLDAGVPIILVGGVLNVMASGGRVVEKHWAPTTVIDYEGEGRSNCLPPRTGDPRPFLGIDSVGDFRRVVVETGAGVEERKRRLREVVCSKEMNRLFRDICRG